LYWEHDEEWAGRLVDQMLYGRTFLFDGTPVVQDVWIDDDGDGAKAADGTEWRRVLVVSQGKGGPVTLALDISDTQSPEFLWEQTDTSDSTAMGYTVGRPTIGNFYDSEEGQDVWTAVWGSGRAVPYSSDAEYFNATEANLYFWAVGEDYWESMELGYTKSNEHPESSNGTGIFSSTTLDSDGDGNYEYGYISAALAAVDTDSDGDVDVMYFPVSTTYGSDAEGDEPGDVTVPGSTWMYKVLVDNTDVDDPEWCEFYDPYDDISSRPGVFYSATAAWMSDGTLGVYYGTGTPYDRDSTDVGYFFAVRDSTPTSCTKGSLITDCGLAGVYALDEGEGLTGDPLVYGGIVFFSTYVPADDGCQIGDGRLYGIDYETCEPALDTNGDGVIDGSDNAYVDVDGYPSAPVVSDSGHVYVGSSDTTGASGDAGVDVIETGIEGFTSTAMISWAEIY
jgi:Tfp pilus tip-associated adhesin PilY1